MAELGSVPLKHQNAVAILVENAMSGPEMGCVMLTRRYVHHPWPIAILAVPTAVVFAVKDVNQRTTTKCQTLL